MNPNKEYHDLNSDHSRAAWNSILECMLSNCNWVSQAQLKQPWSLQCAVTVSYFSGVPFTFMQVLVVGTVTFIDAFGKEQL